MERAVSVESLCLVFGSFEEHAVTQAKWQCLWAVFESENNNYKVYFTRLLKDKITCVKEL